jgi:shikimate dehydrogenase
MKNTAVIGWPIKHSRSPIIHNYWLRQHGIASAYNKLAVSPSDLKVFIRALPGSDLLGCNVTIPHKEAVFQHVDHVDARAKTLGAVNTVYLREGRICGTNTDGEGFLASLRQAVPDIDLGGAHAVVLGAGGAARAIIGALVESGVQHISVVNRSAERVSEVQRIFGPVIQPLDARQRDEALASCRLLVNTTSLGMEGQPRLECDIRNLNPQAIVSDIVYTPLRTEFLERAARQGNRVVEGLGMLLHQAVRGFELWYGVKPQVSQELYDLVAQDVLAGHKP